MAFVTGLCFRRLRFRKDLRAREKRHEKRICFILASVPKPIHLFDFSPKRVPSAPLRAPFFSGNDFKIFFATPPKNLRRNG
jgi:hypothetical protein